MTKSLFRLLEGNARTKEGVSRQAQTSVSVANKSLEAFRQSQRRDNATPTTASRTTAATKVQPTARPLLRTTETEYDVSPSRTARLMTSPPASSFVGTPSRRSHLTHQTPGSMRAASPTHQHSQDQQAEEQTRPEDLATLEWLKQTVDADEFDHQRYTRRASTEVGELPGQQEEHGEHEQTYQPDPFGSTRQQTELYTHKRQSLGSPSRRSRSNEQGEDTYSQKENIPLGTETATPHDPYLSRSTPYLKTPEVDHTVTEAESSLLEVAETTTSITNQLRGVYTNLQEFFSPETEAKLHGAISVIGSQKAGRVAKGLSSSTTRPRPLEFRSASVRKDYRKPSSAPHSTRPLTQPRPFNFSERLSQIQTRRPSASLSARSLGTSSALRPSRAQELQREGINTPTTPVAQNRTVNEYKEMSNAIPYEERVLQDIAQQGGYKAHTVDKRIFESAGDLGVPKIPKPPLTVPKSPAITKRRPAPMRPAIIPSRSEPHHHHQHQHHQHKKHRAGITERGLVSSAESARRLSQGKTVKSDHQEASHGHSVRTAGGSHPAVKPTLTVPEPFSLATEARGERYQEQFRHKLVKWRQIELDHKFKALPLPSYPDVFVPKKSTKALTHIEPVVLQTDRRAEEREVYDQERLRKEKIAQAQKAREDELRELRELKALRERLVPHPVPIRDYPRIEIHRSTRSLTVPRSPNIGEKRKRQMTLERELSSAREEHPHHHHPRQEHRSVSSHDQHVHREHQPQYHDEEEEEEVLYRRKHQQQQQQRYVDPQEELERERERQRENERAQAQEYERRRLSSFSNSRGGEADRERQNKVREEIEQQRERDQGHVLEREARQLQAERQAYRRQSQTRMAVASTSGTAPGVEYGRDDDDDDRREYEQNKRQRILETAAGGGASRYESQTIYTRTMGRKSWLEANDI
ncbi:hypothetical protein BGX33_003561 [Mortierella sp. NVP41]|nr:hypothetical protein BGX33_003561 [Mortierella sp. NVP41]